MPFLQRLDITPTRTYSALFLNHVRLDTTPTRRSIQASRNLTPPAPRRPTPRPSKAPGLPQRPLESYIPVMPKNLDTDDPRSPSADRHPPTTRPGTPSQRGPLTDSKPTVITVQSSDLLT
jgi:hypothetical protein